MNTVYCACGVAPCCPCLKAVSDAAEQDAKDAARYRWLRSAGLDRIKWEGFSTDTCDVGLDYAVDSRIGKA